MKVQGISLLVAPLNAPILPGKGAAGIDLGLPISEVLRSVGLRFTEDVLVNSCVQAPTGTVLYRSDAVDVWATDGVVDQVRVRVGYRGTLAGGVGVGSSRAALAAALGAAENVELDTVTFREHPGLYVTLGGAPGWWDDKPDDAVVTEIYVFA